MSRNLSEIQVTHACAFCLGSGLNLQEKRRENASHENFGHCTLETLCSRLENPAVSAKCPQDVRKVIVPVLGNLYNEKARIGASKKCRKQASTRELLMWPPTQPSQNFTLWFPSPFGRVVRGEGRVGGSTGIFTTFACTPILAYMQTCKLVYLLIPLVKEVMRSVVVLSPVVPAAEPACCSANTENHAP